MSRVNHINLVTNKHRPREYNNWKQKLEVAFTRIRVHTHTKTVLTRTSTAKHKIQLKPLTCHREEVQRFAVLTFLRRRRMGVGTFTARRHWRKGWMEDWTCRESDQIPCRPACDHLVRDRVVVDDKTVNTLMRLTEWLLNVLHIQERRVGLVCRWTHTDSVYVVLACTY